MLSVKPWRAEALIQFMAALLASFCLAGILAALLQKSGVEGFKTPDDFGFLLLGTLSIQGSAWIFILIFLRLHKVRLRDGLGLRGPNLTKSLLLAVAVVALALPFVWLLQHVSVAVLEKIGLPPENQPAVQLLLDAKSIWVQAYLGVFAVVLAPVSEEFIFRGMLYPFIKQLGSPRCAFFGTSALFAEIHFDAGTLVPLFALALLLAWLYEYTDNLLAPITAHSLFNATNLVALHFQDQLNEFLQKLFHVSNLT
jgi:membrane protease YdiL (CAAX protease family)